MTFFNGSREYDLEYAHDLSARKMTRGEGYWVYTSADKSVEWNVEF